MWAAFSFLSPNFFFLLKKLQGIKYVFFTRYVFLLQDSDGEKSDDNLVVDVSNEVHKMFSVVFLVAFLFVCLFVSLFFCTLQ